MLVHFMRVVGVNGLYRAALGTQAAAVTVFGGFRDHAGAASFFVGAIAGDGRLGKMARCQLFLNPGSKGDKLGLVLGIRPPGSKFPHDGMLGYSGHTRHNPEARLLGSVFQLHHGVFKGAVAVYHHQDGRGAVAVDGGQPLDGRRRDPAAVRGDSNQGQIVGCERDFAEMGLAVAEVYRLNGIRQGMGQEIGGLLGCRRWG